MSSPMEPPESHKHQRTVKEELPADEPQLQCHADLCYDDGNVNLVVGSTLFRVHRGMLAKSSPVLKARLFIAPEAHVPEPLTLHLDDDCADVEHLLYSLYDKKCVLLSSYGSHSLFQVQEALFVRSTQIPEVSVVLLSVWLRLGRKYQIARLEEAAMERLNSFYPASFKQYIGLFDDASGMPTVIDSKGIFGTKEKYTETLTLALLALSHGLNQILVLAMYEFCIMASGFEDIAEALAINSTLTRTVRDPQSQKLWVGCFLGRVRLESMNSEHRLSFLDGQLSERCKTRVGCSDVIHGLVQEAHEDKMFVNGHDILNDIANTFIQGSGKSACGHCREFWVGRHLRGHQRIWNALPSIFGVQLDDGEWEYEDIDEDSEEAGNQVNGKDGQNK